MKSAVFIKQSDMYKPFSTGHIHMMAVSSIRRCSL